MWFEIFLIAFTGCILVHLSAGMCKESNKVKICIAILTVLMILYILICRRKSISVEGFLAGYLILVCMVYNLRSMHGVRYDLIAALLFKAAVSALLYLIIIRKCMLPSDNITLSRQSTLSIYLSISVILFFSDKIRGWMSGREHGICFRIIAVLTPVWCFLMIETAFNPSNCDIELKFAVGNIACLVFLFVLLYCLTPKKKIAVGIALTVSLAFGLTNYYVSKFRGSPVMPSDLLSIGTAFQVAGGYVFEVSDQILAAVMEWYIAVAVLCCLPEEEINVNKRRKAAAGVLAFCLSFVCLSAFDVEENYDFAFNYWDIGETYRRVGSTLGFAAMAQKISMDEPEGYSLQRVEEIFYKNDQVEDARQISPTIIAIMDESFGDLRVIGDFECSEEYLKNWYSIDNYIYRGNCYVSVYGGGTANSEFEFLTGCSMANCQGIIPYQVCNMKNVGNIADVLKQAGYETTAVHPEYKGNWNRMKVYANMGFDNFLGIEDFINPQLVQGHICDESSFEKIIELYESGSRKQFIFNVTMQNHGGYNIEEIQEYETIRLKEEWQHYTDVETYLTLIRESDEAINNLLEYFKGVEEPVIICIFGDHLPSVSDSWIEEVRRNSADDLAAAEEMYAVPYMIWANYDTMQEQCRMDISANYLGALLLETAGVPKTAYIDYLNNMRQEIPVINTFGYRMNDGTWHFLEEETPVSGWVDDYRILQYNDMYDKEHDKRYYQP